MLGNTSTKNGNFFECKTSPLEIMYIPTGQKYNFRAFPVERFPINLAHKIQKNSFKDYNSSTVASQ